MRKERPENTIQATSRTLEIDWGAGHRVAVKNLRARGPGGTGG